MGMIKCCHAKNAAALLEIGKMLTRKKIQYRIKVLKKLLWKKWFPRIMTTFAVY